MVLSITSRNLHAGTRLLRHKFDTLQDRGIAVFRLGGADDTAASLNTSILAVLDDQDVFPGTDIPAISAECRFLTHTKRVAVIRYGRPVMSIPTRPAFESARLSTGVVGVRWYKDGSTFNASGQPDGNFQSPDPADQTNGKPTPWTWHAPVVAINAFTVLDFDPTSSVVDFIGRTNTSTVTFRNLGFAANTIRFDGVVSREFDNDGELTYSVSYLFLARRDTWIAPQLDYDSTTAGEWAQTGLLDMYERVWIAGDFPVHD